MGQTAKNLIQETTTVVGTGNATVAAVNGRVRFSDGTYGFGSGATTNVFDYFMCHRTAAEWEHGTGHMSDANTLVRDTVLQSSNADALVSFSAGTKDVWNDLPATRQASPILTLADGATVNWNMDSGLIATLTLGGNRTMAAPTKLQIGTMMLTVNQPSSGGPWDITWNAVFKWPGGVKPALSTAASAVDIISFYCDGTNLYGSYGNGFA